MIPVYLIKEYNDGVKNVVSILYELGAQMNLSVSVEDVSSNVVGKFCAQATVGDVSYAQASASNKKLAKIAAAKIAFQNILQNEKNSKVQLAAPSKCDSNEVVATNKHLKNENNPLLPLLEICNRHKIVIDITPVVSTGSSLNYSLTAVLEKGNVTLKSFGVSKKSAKSDLVTKVMDEIMGYNKTLPSIISGTHFDQITKIVLSQFYAISKINSDFALLKSNLAAFVVKRSNSINGQLICLAGGNCAPEAKEALRNNRGRVLLDCHGYSLARRSFIKYLYQQIKMILVDKKKDSIFRHVGKEEGFYKDQLLVLKDSISIHLYLSSAPCGDSRNSSKSRNIISPFITESEIYTISNQEHRPNFHNPELGTLSYKMLSASNGSVFKDKLFLSSEETNPSYRSLLEDDRNYKTMSCSDKILKANVLGVQGSLLSKHIGPIYINSITIGSDFIEGDYSRAFCCRINDDLLKDHCDPRYHLNHPYIGRPTFCYTNLITCHKPIAFNYCITDGQMETINSKTGTIQDPVSLEKNSSKLTKAANFSRYSCLYKLTKDSFPSALKDAETAKSQNVVYEEVKLKLYDYLYNNGLGSWVKKPVEFEMFSK